MGDFAAVATLAGAGRRGRIDGHRLDKAYFDSPLSACPLANNSVVITDGTHLRVLDFDSEKVATLQTLPFLRPRSPITIDGGMGLCVCDEGHHKIRLMQLQYDGGGGVVASSVSVTQDVTLAGTGKPGHVDGPADSATFNRPSALCVVSDGSILVADSGNGAIRRISGRPGRPGLFVTTIIGGHGHGGGFVDGGPLTARLSGHITAMEHDPATGVVFIADGGNRAIRALHPPPEEALLTGAAARDLPLGSWALTTVAGCGAAGHADSDAAAVDGAFREPAALHLSAVGGGSGSNLLISDAGANTIRCLTSGGRLGHGAELRTLPAGLHAQLGASDLRALLLQCGEKDSAASDDTSDAPIAKRLHTTLIVPPQLITAFAAGHQEARDSIAATLKSLVTGDALGPIVRSSPPKPPFQFSGASASQDSLSPSPLVEAITMLQAAVGAFIVPYHSVPSVHSLHSRFSRLLTIAGAPPMVAASSAIGSKQAAPSQPAIMSRRPAHAAAAAAGKGGRHDPAFVLAGSRSALALTQSPQQFYSDGLAGSEARFRRPGGLCAMPQGIAGAAPGCVVVCDSGNAFLRLLVHSESLGLAADLSSAVPSALMDRLVPPAIIHKAASAVVSQRRKAALQYLEGRQQQKAVSSSAVVNQQPSRQPFSATAPSVTSEAYHSSLIASSDKLVDISAVHPASSFRRPTASSTVKRRPAVASPSPVKPHLSAPAAPSSSFSSSSAVGPARTHAAASSAGGAALAAAQPLPNNKKQQLGMAFRVRSSSRSRGPAAVGAGARDMRSTAAATALLQAAAAAASEPSVSAPPSPTVAVRTSSAVGPAAAPLSSANVSFLSEIPRSEEDDEAHAVAQTADDNASAAPASSRASPGDSIHPPSWSAPSFLDSLDFLASVTLEELLRGGAPVSSSGSRTELAAAAVASQSAAITDSSAASSSPAGASRRARLAPSEPIHGSHSVSALTNAQSSGAAAIDPRRLQSLLRDLRTDLTPELEAQLKDAFLGGNHSRSNNDVSGGIATRAGRWAGRSNRAPQLTSSLAGLVSSSSAAAARAPSPAGVPRGGAAVVSQARAPAATPASNQRRSDHSFTSQRSRASGSGHSTASGRVFAASAEQRLSRAGALSSSFLAEQLCPSRNVGETSSALLGASSSGGGGGGSSSGGGAAYGMRHSRDVLAAEEAGPAAQMMRSLLATLQAQQQPPPEEGPLQGNSDESPPPPPPTTASPLLLQSRFTRHTAASTARLKAAGRPAVHSAPAFLNLSGLVSM